MVLKSYLFGILLKINSLFEILTIKMLKKPERENLFRLFLIIKNVNLDFKILPQKHEDHRISQRIVSVFPSVLSVAQWLFAF